MTETDHHSDGESSEGLAIRRQRKQSPYYTMTNYLITRILINACIDMDKEMF